MLSVFTIWSENYKPLFNRWSNSLPTGFEAVVKKITIPVESSDTIRQFQSMRDKVVLFQDFLNECAEGQVVLFSDADILFLRQSNELELLGLKICETLDMAFMKCHGRDRANTGFYFIKNSQPVRDFIGAAADELIAKQDGNDEEVINRMLRRGVKFKWGFLPTESIICGPNQTFDKDKALVYHAICCNSMDQKLKQQDAIIKRMGG